MPQPVPGLRTVPGRSAWTIRGGLRDSVTVATAKRCDPGTARGPAGQCSVSIRSHQPMNFFATTVALWPPKPNELFTIAFTFNSRAVCGT
jgi:hypothetical protein